MKYYNLLDDVFFLFKIDFNIPYEKMVFTIYRRICFKMLLKIKVYSKASIIYNSYSRVNFSCCYN